MESGVVQLLTPYLEKNERIQDTLILKKATCCFTDRRLFVVRRKQFGFKRYFVDVFYRDITGGEFFRTFNTLFFLYGVLLLLTALSQQAGTYIAVGLAAATFIVVFLFKIHGVQLLHKDSNPTRRVEILGTRRELEKAVVLLRKYDINV